ncbi:hypothetical protein GX586_02855, partial [bacterium]|nr:hypothetical protein [bacterium]
GLRGHVFKLADYPDGFSLLLDMEYIRLVFPRLQLSGVAGATIDLGYTEHLWRDNMHLRLQHNYVATDRLLCSRDTIDWLCPHPRGFRYLMITVRNAKSDVVLKDIALRSAGYPVKHTGSFKCSDKLLTAVWEMGALTQETNMEDAYVDCVGRERGMYGRDTIIQYHVNLAAFGDHALMGRCMQLYGQSPDSTGKFRAVYPNTGDYTIADFALNMVEGYLNYYENSGDLDRIREDWDAIMKNMAWFSSLSDERKDLLLDGEWHLHKGIKAHYGGFHGDLTSDGYMSKKGIHCSFTCTYLIALRSAIKLGKLLGESEAVKDMERRVKILSQSIRTKFWNPKKRCFSDNLKRETHSAHASILAVLAGAVSKQQLPHVRAHIANELKSIFVNGYDPKDGAICSPNYAFYLFDGVYRLGLPETAEGMMRQGWGWMLAQGMKTCGEYFTLGSSLCHAWSAAPTYYLSRNVLGVHYPNAPECGIVEIRVAASKDVTWAEGAYPHPKGAIKVKWHMENGRRVFDHVKAPRGVTVRSVK